MLVATKVEHAQTHPPSSPPQVFTLEQGFSASTLTLGVGQFFGVWESRRRWEGCPVHCSMFSSVPGLYPLETGSHHLPVITTKSVSLSSLTPISPRLPHPCLRTTSSVHQETRTRMSTAALFI